MGKKYKYILMLFMVAFVTFMLQGKNVSAESYSLQEVDDIENAVCPNTDQITIKGNSMLTQVPFTLPTDGTVKAYIKIGVNVNGTGKVWISRDAEGNDIISDVIELAGSEYITEYLDRGTYYLQLRWNQQVDDAAIAIMFERSGSKEEYVSSNFTKATVLSMNKFLKGFLTKNTPVDYYEFTLDEMAYVNVQYSFDSAVDSNRGTAEMKLYNSNQIMIGSNTYDKTDRGMNSAKFKLEAGTYYITLSGFKGDTALCLEPMYYRTEVTPSTTKWTDKDVTVKIDTSIKYLSIDVIKYDATEEDLSSNALWRVDSSDKKYVETNGTTFVAKSNGIYSVRIQDEVGEYILKKIKIANVDKKAPTVTGVKTNTYYNKEKTITWTDKSGSGIKSATLNGKEVTSGVKVSKQGKYKLKVTDKVGNTKTITFYIDTTKPTINDVSNGAVYSYNELVIATFMDNYSGIKKVTINGEEQLESKNSYYFSEYGTFVIRIWDKAGNYATKTIKIK